MKNFIKVSSVSLFAVIVSAGIAKADTIKGVYVNAQSGAVLTQTQHNSISGSSSQVGHSQGFGGNLGVGYGFESVPGLRAEIEGDYFQTHVNRVSPNNAHGHSRNFGGMVQVLYDIDLKRHFDIDVPIVPFVGVGSGYLITQYNVNSPTRDIHGTQGSFGYDGIVGARFNTPVKNLYANVEYRMIGQTMSKDSYHSGDSHFDHKFNHIFNVGLLYNFGGNEPVVEKAVETVPVPDVPRTYIVFFDWDQSNLTNTARHIVDHAAEASRQSQTTKILVNGYSDNSMLHVGSKSGENYNKKLSVKRAESVEAELIKQGVSKDEIFVKGYGDTMQFVKTVPNTREALNRRVEIILQ